MRITLHFAFLISLVTGTIAAQIPNSGFETWNNMGAYENPASWGTMNNTTATFSLFTATKATPGSPGNAYLKLTSKTINGSVVPGVAVCGKLDTVSKMPISGVPYTQRPAAFAGKWQHMIYGSSQGSIMVLLTKWNTTSNTRDTIAHGLQGLSGMAMSWANFSFNLAYMDSLHYPDSCIIVLRSSGSNPTNNDYLWTDNLAFTGTVAIYTPPIDPNPVGLKETAEKNMDFILFPNPSSGQVTISYNIVSSENLSVQIIDIAGKLIQEIFPVTSITGKNTVSITTIGMPKGNYTVVIRSNNSTTSKKLLIE